MSVQNNYFPSKQFDNTDSYGDLALRLGKSALPFFKLYPPFSLPATLVNISLRTYTTLSDTKMDYYALHATLAVAALAATLLLHPVGMLITSGHDMLNDLMFLAAHLQAGEYAEAFENMAHCLNSALFIGVLAGGPVQVLIASLALQMCLGVYHSIQEFRKGNRIEGFAHLTMALICGYQLKKVITRLQKEPDMKILSTHDSKIDKIKITWDFDPITDMWNSWAVFRLADGSLWKVDGNAYLGANWDIGDHITIEQDGDRWMAYNHSRNSSYQVYLKH